MTTTGTEAPGPSSGSPPRGQRVRPTERPRRAKRAAKANGVVRSERRYVQTVRSIDIWSVCKMSVVFNLCALIVVLCAGVVLWWIAVALGAVGNVEQFVGDLFNNDDFRLLSWAVLRSATLIGLAFVCVATVVAVLTASLYNLFAEVFGGIEVTIAEREGPVT